MLVSGCAQYAADHVLGHSRRGDSYEKQATLYPEKLRSEYAKASERLNIFASIERHLRGAGADSGEQAAPEDGRYQRIEAQQRIMQETLQKMAGSMTDVLRIAAAGREGSPGAVPDDVVNRLMGLDGCTGRTRRILGIGQGAVNPIGFALIMRHFQVPRACRRAKGVQRAAAGGKTSGKERIRRAGTRRTFQDVEEVLRWSRTRRMFYGGSRTWRPDGKARRHGVPAGRQGRGKRIKEMAVACSGHGVPAVQWGCHSAEGLYRVLSGTPDGLMGCHARPLPQAWSARVVTRPVSCAEMISSATGEDFGLGGTAACGDGGGAFALVVASGGDGARIMRIGTMKTEERRCGKPF